MSGFSLVIPSGAAHALVVLRQRNFGLVWSSIMFGSLGTQMEQVVLAWFVLTLTDSPFLVGLVTFARLGANIFALFAGALADRVSRRSLLIVVQFIIAALALFLLALVLRGLLEVWHIFAIAFIGGLVRIFELPAGQALIADSVSQERISNGVALTSAGMNLTLVLGPLLGGVLFQSFGPTGAYTLITLSHALGGVCALLVRVEGAKTASQKEPVWTMVVQGLRYVWRQQVLFTALLTAVVFNLTAFPFATTLLPVFARNVLDTESAGLGVLTAALGLGSLIGSFGLAAVRDLRNAGKWLIAGVIVWHLAIMVFSTSTSFYLSIALLLATGVARGASMVLVLSLLLRNALPEYRGRIMGLRVLAIYAHPLGSLVWGGVAGGWGAPLAASIAGVVGIALTSVLALLSPRLRRA